jgi:hypothetical protein
MRTFSQYRITKPHNEDATQKQEMTWAQPYPKNTARSALTWEQYTVRKKIHIKISHFGYIKGISPDQYGVHAHYKRTNIVKISPPLFDFRETQSCQKSSVVRESLWVKQLSVDKILSPTSSKVSGYFCRNSVKI